MEEKLHLKVGFHHDNDVEITIPASLMTPENGKGFWPEIQRQLAEHFLRCVENGEISPTIAGFGPQPESRILFEKLWAEAVAAKEAKEKGK